MWGAWLLVMLCLWPWWLGLHCYATKIYNNASWKPQHTRLCWFPRQGRWYVAYLKRVKNAKGLTCKLLPPSTPLLTIRFNLCNLVMDESMEALPTTQKEKSTTSLVHTQRTAPRFGSQTRSRTQRKRYDKRSKRADGILNTWSFEEVVGNPRKLFVVNPLIWSSTTSSICLPRVASWSTWLKKITDFNNFNFDLQQASKVTSHRG